MTQKTKNISGKKIRSSIKKEGIDPAAYNKYKLPWACEDCVHYSGSQASDHHQEQRCTLGYLTEPHLRKNLKKSYELSGKVTLCRFLEID